MSHIANRQTVSERSFDIVITWGEYITGNSFHIHFIDGDLRIVTSPDIETFLRVTYKGEIVFYEDHGDEDVYIPGEWLEQLWAYEL